MMAYLAQFDSEDWVQLAVVAIIIIGSFIANFINSLSKRWRGEREQETESRPQRPIPPVGRSEWAGLPTAEPMPPRPMQREHARPAGDRPLPTAVPRPPRVYKAQPARPVSTTGQPAPLPRREPPPPRPQKQLRQTAPAAKKPPRRPDVTETVSSHEFQRAAESAERIGHVDPGLVEPLPDDLGEVMGLKEHVSGIATPRINRKTARDGIILAEVLGPPVALRGDVAERF